jgi:hypothetical protein
VFGRSRLHETATAHVSAVSEDGDDLGLRGDVEVSAESLLSRSLGSRVELRSAHGHLHFLRARLALVVYPVTSMTLTM